MNRRDDRSPDSQSNRASTPRCREPEKHADQGEDAPPGRTLPNAESSSWSRVEEAVMDEARADRNRERQRG